MTKITVERELPPCPLGYGHGGRWCGPDTNCWLDPRSRDERAAANRSVVHTRTDNTETLRNALARIEVLEELLSTARDYVYSELEERKAALAGYPHKWQQEEADLAAIDAALTTKP